MIYIEDYDDFAYISESKISTFIEKHKYKIADIYKKSKKLGKILGISLAILSTIGMLAAIHLTYVISMYVTDPGYVSKNRVKESVDSNRDHVIDQFEKSEAYDILSNIADKYDGPIDKIHKVKVSDSDLDKISKSLIKIKIK